jgi:DNA-directed RNA polymerase specialized sigma24 family protein
MPEGRSSAGCSHPLRAGRLTLPYGADNVRPPILTTTSSWPGPLNEVLLAIAAAAPTEVNRHIERFHRLAGTRCVGLLKGFLRGTASEGDAEDIYHEFLVTLPSKTRGLECANEHSGWVWARTSLIRRAISERRRRRSETLEAEVREAPSVPTPAESNLPDARDWPRLVKETLRHARPQERAELRRNLAILRDFHFEDLDMNALAIRYFGSDNAANRNKVSAYKRRASQKLKSVWEGLNAGPRVKVRA